MRSLISEATAGIQYKNLSSSNRVFAFIGVFPFIATSVIGIILYEILNFFYNIVASAVKYLEAWVDDKKKDVQHATEAVLYFVTMPWIFFCNVLLSFAAVFFYLIWFVVECVLYIATLGGIKWQPYINNASYDEPNTWEITTADGPATAVSLIAFIGYAMYLLLFIIGSVLSEYGIIDAANVISYIYWVFTCIAVPVTFRKRALDPDTIVEYDDTAEDDDDDDEELPEL